MFETDPIHIIDIRDLSCADPDCRRHAGDDVLKVVAIVQWVTAPNVDGRGQVKRNWLREDGHGGDPIACEHCKPADPHVHPLVVAYGCTSATTNHFNADHFHHPKGEPGGIGGPACECKPRAMTRDEVTGLADQLIREQFPSPIGRSLL